MEIYPVSLLPPSVGKSPIIKPMLLFCTLSDFQLLKESIIKLSKATFFADNRCWWKSDDCFIRVNFLVAVAATSINLLVSLQAIDSQVSLIIFIFILLNYYIKSL